jgi:formate-dependent nitrite reductase membrane component NrfD
MSAATGASTGVPSGEGFRSYYGQPIIKEPVWRLEIPWYFFTGGLGGASAALAYLSERRGCEVLARRSWVIALAALTVSPLLLISDLGMPRRFLNMLRMLRITSPMSVGSWLLALGGATTALSALCTVTGRLRWLAALGKPAAAVLGLPVSTYTGALIAQTAVPVWHEARQELPVVFAAGAALSAGAAATAATPPRQAAPARRLALLGAGVELAAMQVMEKRLAELGEPYHSGRSGTYSRAARGLTAGGALLCALGARRSRPAAVASAGLLLAGAVCTRFSVFRAGFQSASEPRYTVAPQRRRVEEGRGHGASKRAARFTR